MSSDASVSEFEPLLGQSVGYGVVVGVGFFFAGVMLVLTYLQTRYTTMSPGSSEEFTPGLVCCGIVSAWTWSATLLQSSTAAYTFGISGPWWYGVGGTIQLAIFGMVAAKVKMNANGAHTFLEIVQVRFGTGPHLLFTFYGFLCNLIVCGSLLYAACMLLPIGIAVYVLVGGLRATFICDWSHTVILFIIIYLASRFIFKTYGTSQETEGVSGLYDLLQAAAITSPVEGNQNGSYLTMKSNQGLVFGAATILSGFSGIFCDQGMHSKPSHGKTSSVHTDFMLGGLSWFAVPFAFASCLGPAISRSRHPKFPTYPNPLSASQTSAGLAAPAAAAVLMGKSGAIAVLLVVFMAVTSAASAELIGVSSLFVYRTYFRPQAKGPEIVKVSHCFICFWAVWMGAWAVILNKAGVDLGWLPHITSVLTYFGRGVVLSPAVIPVALTISWSKLTKLAVILGPILGAIFGMAAWMIGCWKILGSITITNLANPYSAVCSGLTGLLFSGVITVGISLWRPAHYDFKGTRAIANLDSEGEIEPSSNGSEDDKDEITAIDTVGDREAVLLVEGGTVDISVLRKSFKRAAWYSSALTLIVTIIVPLPMFFSHYVYSKPFYTFWVSTSIIWVLLSGFFSVLLPVWESRQEILDIVYGCLESLRGKN
ncbi:Na+/solute symporter [Lentinula raphanica]|nr:Na+/solute symporter [Lentinula raphanica]